MRNLTFLIFGLLALTLTNGEKFSFEGYRLVNIIPKTSFHVGIIDEWEDKPDFDVWNRVRGLDQPVTVALSPIAFEKYAALFKFFDIEYSVIDENIQQKIDEEARSMELNQRSVEDPSPRNIVGKYARYNEILSFIDSTVATYPNLASSYVAGTTYENRQIKALVLKTSTSQKAVWIDCGIHAREWVSPSTCIWFIDALIKNYNNNEATAVELLKYYEFHIMPVVNPDGYEYTHTTFRLWRKNRNPNKNSACIGTDLNRNFDYQWMVAGASLDPCSDIHAGPSAGSELETKALKNAINNKLGQWDAFITIHSYGNFWMVPWGFGTVRPSDYSDLVSVSQVGAAALKAVYGTTFTIGSPASLLYSAAGGNFDWSKGTAGIKYSIALELRPGQSGTDSQYGFTLPESRAPLVGAETYAGLVAMIKEIKARLSAGK